MKCKEKAIGQRLWQDPTLSNFNLPTDTNATVPSILSITVSITTDTSTTNPTVVLLLI